MICVYLHVMAIEIVVEVTDSLDYSQHLHVSYIIVLLLG